MPDPDCPYVSRGGLKLAAALDAFDLDPRNLDCADLGCSTGGFTDCLIQRHARHVYSVDTAYGQFAWKLRQHPDVTTLERTNALHFDPQTQLADFAGCDLVVLDLGWTRQSRALPAAMQWLKHSPDARIITLIKPHYEATDLALSGTSRASKGPRRGQLTDTQADEVTQTLLATLPQQLGLEPIHHIRSPIRGGKAGNREHLALLAVHTRR